MPKQFVMQVETAGLSVQVDVNDVPVFVETGPRRLSTVRQLDLWIEPGENEVRVTVDRPVQGGAPPGSPRCWIRAEGVAAGARLGAAPPLVEFRWPPPDVGQESYPHQSVFRFHVDDAPACRLWNDAVPVALNDVVRRDVLTAVQALHERLDARDAAGAIGLLEYKAQDAARAFNGTVEQMREGMAELYEHVFRADKFGMAPFSSDELELHRVGRGRIVWVTGPDGRPALRTQSAAAAGLQVPVYLAFVNNRWAIVR